VAAAPAHVALASYYARPAVRRRVAEYCGGTDLAPASLTALTAGGYGGRRGLREPEGAVVPQPLGALPELLAEGADVCRSLADSGGTLLLLDVDYTHPADPGEAYRDPAACFARVEPTHEAVRAAFARYGLAPLVLMTGRGYHYVLRAVEGGALHAAAVRIGARAAHLPAREDRLKSLSRVAVNMERAHHGAGRLLEFLAHQVVREASPRSPAPVTLADLPLPDGGPFVCLDLTAYADPVMSRQTRCAFSANQKASVMGIDTERPFVLTLPRPDASYPDLLAARHEPERAAWLADRTSARIPDVADAEVWCAEYAASPLAAVHEGIDEGMRAPAAATAYDLGNRPACALAPLGNPNPWLLQPRHLRAVSLGLWSAGWPPAAIVGLVHARLREPHGWGALWERYDPGSRAAFYVRLFCGAAEVGLEDGAFDCRGQAALGLCPHAACGCDLGAAFARRRDRPPDRAAS
jgi:hypothetical protein